MPVFCSCVSRPVVVLLVDTYLYLYSRRPVRFLTPLPKHGPSTYAPRARGARREGSEPPRGRCRPPTPTKISPQRVRFTVPSHPAPVAPPSRAPRKLHAVAVLCGAHKGPCPSLCVRDRERIRGSRTVAAMAHEWFPPQWLNGPRARIPRSSSAQPTCTAHPVPHTFLCRTRSQGHKPHGRGSAGPTHAYGHLGCLEAAPP